MRIEERNRTEDLFIKAKTMLSSLEGVMDEAWIDQEFEDIQRSFKRKDDKALIDSIEAYERRLDPGYNFEYDESIEVLGDFRIPGTDIILEKGDSIKILEKEEIEETTLDQHVRARYEELTGKDGMAPQAAVSVLVDEIPIPERVLLPMLQKWGYFVGPMDSR